MAKWYCFPGFRGYSEPNLALALPVGLLTQALGPILDKCGPNGPQDTFPPTY